MTLWPTLGAGLENPPSEVDWRYRFSFLTFHCGPLIFAQCCSLLYVLSELSPWMRDKSWNTSAYCGHCLGTCLQGPVSPEGVAAGAGGGLVLSTRGSMTQESSTNSSPPFLNDRLHCLTPPHPMLVPPPLWTATRWAALGMTLSRPSYRMHVE